MRGRHSTHALHFSITISRVPLQPYHSKCAPCLCSSPSMPNENVGFLYAPPYSRRNLGFILSTLAFPARNLSCPSGIALPVQDFLLIPLLSLFRCFLKSFLSFFRDACPASQPIRPNCCSEADRVFERGEQPGWGKVPGSTFWQPRRECPKSHHLMWHSMHIFTLKYQELYLCSDSQMLCI